MNTDPRLEQRVASALNRAASTREPDGLLDSVLSTVGLTRARPRWLALIKEPPMRIQSKVAVGSPTARLAYLFLLVLMLTIVATGAVVAGASLAPTTSAIVVAQDGSGTVTTITEAVAMAQNGDTVLVKPGTYLESIAITEDITLRGDGDRKAVVLEFAADGPTHSWAEDGTFAYGVLLDDSNARVENLTVRGPAEGGAFVIDGGAPVIDGVAIVLDGDPWGGPTGMFFKRSAFRIQGGSSPVIRDSTWDGYTRINGVANSPMFEGNIVTVQEIRMSGGGQQPIIRGNTFLDGGFSWPDSGSGGIAEDNDVVGCVGVAAGNDPILRGNRIRGGCPLDWGGAAIAIGGPSTSVVADNEITDSRYGIHVSGRGATSDISGNTIRGSAGAAIVVEQGAAPTIDGNTIERNATGIEVIGISTPVMTGNKLCENGTDLVVPDGSTLTLAGNTLCGEVVSAAP